MMEAFTDVAKGGVAVGGVATGYSLAELSQIAAIVSYVLTGVYVGFMLFFLLRDKWWRQRGRKS